MSQWHIIRVVGARERHVAGELQRGLGLRTYYPVEKFKITRKARTIEKTRPLMPNYVFAGCIDSMPWRDIAATKGVVDWLTIDDDIPATVSGSEIERIRQLEREFNRTKDDRRQLRAGDRARPTKGPFESIDVLLRSIRGSTATIEVPMLGSTRTAQIRLSDLAPVL